jgi:hypothetical protein
MNRLLTNDINDYTILSIAVILVKVQTSFNARTGGSGVTTYGQYLQSACVLLLMHLWVLKAWDAAKNSYGASLIVLLMMCICPYNMLYKME